MTPIYWKSRNFAGNTFDSQRGKLYDSALMSRQVPDFINPIHAAEGKFSIAGQLAFGRMKRLLEVVNNPEDKAEVTLNFSVDGQGIPTVRGRVYADLVLTCQRCLEPVRINVDEDICLGIVASVDEAKRLPEEYDPLVTRGDQLFIAEAVEDEIFLALPAISRHDPGVCATMENVGRRESSSEESADEPSSPFTVLAQLKVKR